MAKETKIWISAPPEGQGPDGARYGAFNESFEGLTASGGPIRPGPAEARRGGPLEGPRAEGEFDWPQRSGRDWAMEDLLSLMAWGRKRGMSDLIFTSSDQPWMRVAGIWERVGEGSVPITELTALLNRLSRNEAAASMVGSGVELDLGCELRQGRFDKIRFRGNATAVADGWTTGLTVTLRLLPELPPSPESLGIEPELFAALFPANGLVAVTGVMGSGKTTLLASILRRLAETCPRHIATFESPIECDLVSVPGRKAPVEQSEIPRHVGSFAEAARNLTRRAADVVLIGESRDPQTIRGVLEAAEIGVTAYTTLHTRSVADTVGRLISVFNQKEWASVVSMFLSAIRVIVQQRLYPSPGGGRHAVREYLILDEEARSRLLTVPIHLLSLEIENLVQTRGQPLERAVRRAVLAGKLSPEILAGVLAEKGRRPNGDGQ